MRGWQHDSVAGDAHAARHGPGRRALVVAAGYPAALVVLAAVHALAPQRAGPLALTQVFAPHLFLPLLALVPVLLWRPARGGLFGVTLTVALLVGAVRFGPVLVSGAPAATTGAPTVTAAAWNIEGDSPSVAAVVAAIAGMAADVVALPELEHARAAAIDADPLLRRRYPHRMLRPAGGPLGMGLLSRYPIVDGGALADPPLLWTVLDLGEGRLGVVAAHPLPARIDPGPFGLPTGYDARSRDERLLHVRSIVDRTAAAADGRVVLLGDLNVTDQEPAYRDIADGLLDAHREVGLGPGWTWRPGSLEGLPFGILRIDYAMSTPLVRPLSVSTDCTPRGSDHCIVRATFEVGSGA